MEISGKELWNKSKKFVYIAGIVWLVFACLIGTTLSFVLPAIGETARSAADVEFTAWVGVLYVINWLFTVAVWTFIQAVFTIVVLAFVFFGFMLYAFFSKRLEV